MNTKGTRKGLGRTTAAVVTAGLIESKWSGRLQEALRKMSDREALKAFHEFQGMKAEKGGRPLEELAYPLSFLDAPTGAARQAMFDSLLMQGVDADTLGLVSHLLTLNSWTGEAATWPDGRVGWMVNAGLRETVEKTIRQVEKVGGRPVYGAR